MDFEHVHRLTGAAKKEIDVGGKKAEYCIIPDSQWLNHRLDSFQLSSFLIDLMTKSLSPYRACDFVVYQFYEP